MGIPLDITPLGQLDQSQPSPNLRVEFLLKTAGGHQGCGRFVE